MSAGTGGTTAGAFLTKIETKSYWESCVRFKF